MDNLTSTRRNFLQQVAFGGGSAFLSILVHASTQASRTPEGREKSLILLWQDGGPSHFE